MRIEDYLNANTAVEVLAHEGLVLSAYKDSKDVWTWGPGLTSASGHRVERYKDNPQTLEYTLGVYLWALRKYAQEVLDAFDGYTLKQHEFDAALSFHWNTGAIGRATWVKIIKAGGSREDARASFMTWTKDKELKGRRSTEARLFFEGLYHNDGKTTIYTRLTKGYTPVWSSAKRVETLSTFKRLLEPAVLQVPDMSVVIDTLEEPVATIDKPVIDYPVEVPAKPAYSFWQSAWNWFKRLFANN